MSKLVQSAVFRWAVLCLLLLLTLGAIAMLAAAKAEKRLPQVVVLHQPFTRPSLLRDRIFSLVPQKPGWAWLWRLQNTVFGKRKLVDVSAQVVSIPNITPGMPSSMWPPAPSYADDESGLRCWILDAERLNDVREALKQIPGAEVVSRPKFSTADGIASRIGQQHMISAPGSSTVHELTFECFPRVRRDSTDLMLDMTSWKKVTKSPAPSAESGISSQTNLNLALRLQIPKGSGAFLLFQGRDADSAQNQVGVMVEASQK